MSANHAMATLPRRRTVLLVDDEPAILAALQRCLRNEDYEILTAKDGYSALEVMIDHEVGVMVCDDRLRDMMAAELIEEVRHRQPDTVHVLLTEFGDAAALHEAITTCKLYKIMPKPWDSGDMIRTVRDAFVSYEALALSRPQGMAYRHA